MKKLNNIVIFLLAAVMTVVSVQTDFLSMPAVSTAAESYINIEYNDMQFCSREGKENELTLTSYFGTEEDLVIPETVDGYTVTSIESTAFRNGAIFGSTVKNVTLPDTIDYISMYAFENSTIVSVNIPKNLKFIPSYTFRKCKDLTTVKFHDDLIGIANTAFEGTDIVIPQNLQQRIADDSKEKCQSSKSNYIMKNDDFEFIIATNKDDDSLYCNIENYTGIGSEIFIPDSIYGVPVKLIKFTKFDASEITAVTFPKTTENITINTDSFSNSLITELNINSPCTLNRMAFGNCANLKTVRFNGDITIDRSAFDGCTNLTSVEFGGNADLEPYAFNNCHSLKNITVDPSLTIKGNAFNDCAELMNINSEPAFDDKTGELNPKYNDFIRKNFYMSEEVEFINEYVKAQYEKIADEVTAPEMSDAEKVKALHDWICANTTYTKGDINLPEYHTDGSILLNDSTVCEGYAKALNLLCNYAGVESYYIHSNDHAWNIVKIGGHYFHVDPTWDDTDGTKSYEWFMRSDSEMRDDNSHSKWEAYIPTSLHSFQKEGTPECKYQIGDVNNDLEISAADLVRMNKVILNAEIETADNIVLYDLNFDGKVNAFDLILMRRKIIDQGLQ